MGISPVLNGLIKKHVELQTSLRDREDAADKAEDEINHLARTIKTLDPDYALVADNVIQTKNADMTYLALRVAIHLKQMASLSMIKELDRMKNESHYTKCSTRLYIPANIHVEYGDNLPQMS